MTEAARGVLRAGLLLGIGMGGFVDGIVLHQILQWHQMLSNVVPADDLVGAKVNMVWDGVFHAGMWVVVVLGIVQLWQLAARHRLVGQGRSLIGAALLGWAGFNLLEGLIDHHLLALHHVRDAAAHPLAWDIGFLLVSAAIAVAGWLLRRDPPGTVSKNANENIAAP